MFLLVSICFCSFLTACFCLLLLLLDDDDDDDDDDDENDDGNRACLVSSWPDLRSARIERFGTAQVVETKYFHGLPGFLAAARRPLRPWLLVLVSSFGHHHDHHVGGGQNTTTALVSSLRGPPALEWRM